MILFASCRHPLLVSFPVNELSGDLARVCRILGFAFSTAPRLWERPDVFEYLQIRPGRPSIRGVSASALRPLSCCAKSGSSPPLQSRSPSLPRIWETSIHSRCLADRDHAVGKAYTSS